MIERVFLDGPGKCLVCKCELQGMNPQPKNDMNKAKDAARGGGGSGKEGLRKKKSSYEFATWTAKAGRTTGGMSVLISDFVKRKRV
jgi:hypothetical protein